MASSIASLTDGGEETIATAVVVLALATATLGICVTLVGHFKLAGLITHIPMPVVAGFLAFIGLFCMLAGLGLATGIDISRIQDLIKLDMNAAILSIPAIGSGAIMALVSHYAPPSLWWALPATIVIIPAFFYLVLFMSGKTLDDSRADGWIAESANFIPLSSIIGSFDFSKVKWSVIPQQVLTWASMTLLVVFSSALDIIAVELDLGGKQIDIDRELRTVGISNIVSGLCGGYTGSYSKY